MKFELQSKPTIGVMLGDVTGIGPEIAAKVLASGAYALPHAATHAAVLPHAVACLEAFAPTAMSRLAAALGAASDPAKALWDLTARLGAPTSLAQLGFRHQDVDAAADLVVAAAADKNLAGPRPVEREWVAELLLAAWDGTRPQDS